MAGSALTSLNKNRLRRWLILFFFALAIPSGLLVYHAYDQLKWEAFHRHRVQAEELATRIDKRYARLIEEEERRAFVDYNFLVVAGDPASNFIQRSALSSFPVRSPIPGLIGHFQVDNEGLFKTPLLPDSALVAAEYGIQADELEQREELANRVRAILGENRLLRAELQADKEQELRRDLAAPEEISLSDKSGTLFSSSDESDRSRDRRSGIEDDSTSAGFKISEGVSSSQAAFDRLSEQKTDRPARSSPGTNLLGRVEDLELDSSFEAAQTPQQQRTLSTKKSKLEKRAPRKERSVLPEPESPVPQSASAGAPEEVQSTQLRIRTFESEIDPFEMSLLDSGHIVLYRKVWRDNQRYIQGALIEQNAFLSKIIEASFDETNLARMSDLITAYRGNLLTAFSASAGNRYQTGAGELRGALLYQTRLTSPLNDLDLIFTIQHLPAGPGGSVIAWIAIILFLLLSAGFYAIYRLGLGQINLLVQQQDFVSAVSHELKTPLTSIRMYGEMLREGWVVEAKRQEYYAYIQDESERLTRLINNVLQLARMTRNDLQIELKPVSAGELIDMIGSKIESQVTRAGFTLNLNRAGDCESRTLQIDPDYFTQIIINLVDNAIKFSAKAERKAIDIGCQGAQDGTLTFRVRDHGPGIAKDQMKKIFKLFYRSENELTRETVGTGIGLALVNQLAVAMNGSVDVVNMTPGAEFRINFPSQ
ncbi:MAG: HAMP domain-containing histidine kinase [Candidatus Thiodiazotropha sp. (ex Ctena orbiculata)]|nr:HAMP domain-containing histidine kinase [Candidatus Thiodiazotropha taylori]PUB86287.1 MAG: sensor histidine kinase [gamma proteobacterium symbiont of Ctena orbiculata]MBT2995734.1 HAMP domain-containing histidine kinase [Candidatus Thiodiazotropha taylori]MBT2999311.1 HAMP domain-containing histidine kinase [Candidatus Thiodiazotropha taylori]MBV2108473.1 HAMP domain-containing histidine kinase [Candidatus Thiodiazotropha taylori]